MDLCRNIFSSDDRKRFLLMEEYAGQTAQYVRHRIFTRWVEANMPDWVLLEHLANRHPLSAPDGQGSLADFYFYQKRSGR